MPLSNKLTKFSTSAPNLISYNFTDIEEGTGTVIYYPFLGRTTVAKYMMSTEIIQGEIEGEGDTFNAKTTIADRTFETGKFNTSRVLKGTALLKLPLDAMNDTGVDIMLIESTITLKKYDGDSETTIVTITPATETTVMGQPLKKDFFLIEFNVPVTNIAVGDSIRLNVKVEMTKTSGSGTQCEGAVGYDPKGREFYSVGPGATAHIPNTQMQLNLPFLIE